MVRLSLRVRALLADVAGFANHLTGNVYERSPDRVLKKRIFRKSLLENLESRQLMAFAPLATDDAAFYTSTNTDLTVTTSSSPAYLLANDLDVQGNALTASVVAGPASGSLTTFNNNGTFTYHPNTGFTGVDSFTYKVNNGSLDSNIAKVTIAVGTKLLGRSNYDANYLHSFSTLGPDTPTIDNEVDEASGGLVLTESVTPDLNLVYRSSSAMVKPVIAVETKLASGVSVPSSITAQLTFNGTAGTTYSYSTTGMSTGQAMRFAIQADGSSLATGMYDWSMSIGMTISGTTTYQTFTGKQAIVNRSASVFGSGWNLDGLDRLYDGTNGALLVKGNGDSLWFAKSGSTYSNAAGDQSNATLVKTGSNTYTLTDKYGTVRNFSTLGLLTSVVDSNSNTTSYAYADRNSDGIAAELISITDPFSRVTNINYTSGYVSSIAHFSGQTTSLSISSGSLTGYTLTDPDGAGTLTAPVFSFGYTSGQVSSRTNPLSQTTSYSYNTTDGRLRTITYPDTKTWQLAPIDVLGLPTGTSGNTVANPANDQASITDQRSNVWKLRTDRFGQTTEWITALGYTYSLTRDPNSNVVVDTRPDPDGTGPLTVTSLMYGYTAAQDLSYQKAQDGGVTTWTYNSLSRELSSTDAAGRTTSKTYDSYGNAVTSTDGGGFVTTIAYNTRGLPTSITAPDPDGAGSLTAPVTGLAYDSYGRLITLTNPDSSTKTFTYNSADEQLTATDELGKTTTNAYDNLGRLTSVTNRVSAVTSYEYDGLSRKTKETDPLGNATVIAYNNRGWVSSVTYPDPDGAGSLTAPVDNRTYDGVGNMTATGDPDGGYSGSTPYTYDADNRLISKGSAGNPGWYETWDYDNQGRLLNAYRASAGGYPDRTTYSYDLANRVLSKTIQQPSFYSTPIVYYAESYTYNLAGELASKSDGRGNKTSYTYNTRGLVATETLPDPDNSGSQFSLVITHSYDNMGRETSTDHGLGRISTQEYNSRSWLTKYTDVDPDGAGSLTSPVTQFGYNTRGDRTTATDPLGNVTTTAYDDEQRPTSVTLPDPDGAGSLTSPVTSTAYNAANWVTSTTDARGGVTAYTYDNAGRVLTTTYPDPDGAGSLTSPVITNQYNAQGLWKVTDAMSHTTTYGRDNKGRVTTVTDPASNVITYAYDFYGNVTSETDPDPDGAGSLTSPVTSYTYDSVNRMTSKTDPKSGVTQYTYDTASNLTSLKDPDNNTTNFGYDGWNRQVLNTNSLSKSKSYTYDVVGDLTRTVDRNGKVIQYQYDNLDRPTTELWQQSASPTPTLTVGTTQDGGPINEQQSVGWTTSAYSLSGTFTLSFNGQTTSAIAWNASAATIQSALEALSTIGTGNIAVTVTIPPGSTNSRTIGLTFQGTKAATDVVQATINTSGLSGYPSGVSSFANTTVTGGNFTETQTLVLANASGGTWRVAYNGEVSAPLSPSITASQLKTVLDGFAGIDSTTVTGSSGNFTVTFGGTQSSTNMSQIFGDAADTLSGTTVRTISTVYNANSQVTSESDPSSTITYTLDNLSRHTGVSQSVNGLTPTVSLTQGFDAANNRTQLTATIGSTNDFKSTYQYDALQRLTDIVQQSQSGGNAVTAKHITLSYNALNQRSNIARYQSTGTTSAVATTDWTYDSDNRLSTITHKQGTTTLNSYSYSYDAMSRITGITQATDGTFAYTYDASSQLTAATYSGQTNESYGFDANGNRNTTGYTTSNNNQTTAAPGYTYTYDDEGNRLTKTETSTGHVESYEWDYRNRLTGVIDRNSSGGAIVRQVNYEYDTHNRLVKRTIDPDGAGSSPATSQYWTYDDGINAVVQFDGSSASNLSHRYLWSNQVDDLIADEQVTSLSTGGNCLWGLADHLGTQRDIADLNEGTGVTSVTNHRKYTAFGGLVSETNTAVDLIFGYTGKQLDDATGLQHNLNRWYDSAIGQWMNEDPTGFEAGDENIRRYVNGRPTSHSDPSGLFDIDRSSDYLREMYRLRLRAEWEQRRESFVRGQANFRAQQRVVDNARRAYNKALEKVESFERVLKAELEREDAENNRLLNEQIRRDMEAVDELTEKLEAQSRELQRAYAELMRTKNQLYQDYERKNPYHELNPK